MKDSDMLSDRERFDSVWRRVTGENGSASHEAAEPVCTGGDSVTLRSFIEDEYGDMRTYNALAARCSGAARRTLLSIAADERDHLRALRAAYFLETGDAWAPAPACPVITSVSETLRQRYSGENAGGKAYLEAAQRTGNNSVADLYRRNAEDEFRHVGCLMRLIERMMA